MNKNQPDKKKFSFGCKDQVISNLEKNFVYRYTNCFKVYRRDNTPTAANYFNALIACEKGKANMERMEEEIPYSDYRAYQHFISNSKWDHKELIGRVSRDASALMAKNKTDKGFATGYIIDESAHLKKGVGSVGTAKQYAGVAGKVENCQVGVYASLVNDNRATIINAKIFLPETWTKSKSKCDKAGVPEGERVFRTKPELALEMVDRDLANGVSFDWVGGDGLYGHSFELTEGLNKRGVFYVLDVHRDELVFKEMPKIEVPKKKPGSKGRPPKSPKPNAGPVRLDNYLESLGPKGFETVKVRKTAKGWLKLKVHVSTVWIWNKSSNTLSERALVITKTTGKKTEVKYSFSNGSQDQYTPKEYAYFQAQRYWVERTFDDSKNELGMSDYQIRKWIGWHHHMSLVITAGLFLLEEKMLHDKDLPLMSTRDARQLMIVFFFGTEEQKETRIRQMIERHKKRKADIDRRYRYQEIEEILLK